MVEGREKKRKTVSARRAHLLLTERNDVSVILHILEQDKTMNPAPWQVESLKHSLRELDQEIGSRDMTNERG